MTQREGKGITTLRQNYIQDTKINSRPPCVCKTASKYNRNEERVAAFAFLIRRPMSGRWGEGREEGEAREKSEARTLRRRA